MTSAPIAVRLNRATGQQWGFRLHGGKDFNQPLIILKVAGSSIAEQSGLGAGDVILGINGQDTTMMKHKDAQDLIAKSGNSVEFMVQKGATSTWAPTVTPVGDLKVGSSGGLVTKTSLAKNQSSGGFRSGPGINSAAKPFLTKDGRAMVNNQFNSPINMYSEANIAETLSAQAEVLAGGAIGVNFKKNEKKYNYEDSEVYKMLKQVEKEPTDSQHVEDRTRPAEMEKVPPPQLTQTINQLRPVRAPEPKSAEPSQQGGGNQQGGNNPNLCAECERLIVGVFVRIKDKNLHVECFKCATCGQSLKNIGYFNINNKLYCDVHAQLIARNNPPGPGLEPFATVPGLGAPSGPSISPLPTVTTIPMTDVLAPCGITDAGLAGSALSSSTTNNNVNASATTNPTSVILSNTGNVSPSSFTSTTALPQHHSWAPSGAVTSSISTSEQQQSTSSILKGLDSTTSTGLSDVTGNLTLSTSPINAPEPQQQHQQQQFSSYGAGPRSPNVDPYAAGSMAPQSFNQLPTARPANVQAPTKTYKESSFMEKKSFTTETITKSGPGSKFTWPPVQGPNDDPVMLGGGAPEGPAPTQVHNIPIERQQSVNSQQQQQQQQQQQNFSQQQSYSQQFSSFGQSADSSLGQFGTSAPSSFYQHQGVSQPAYKPVVPPKPRSGPQVPYKPVSNLLAPANRAPAPGPSPVGQSIPMQTIPASLYSAPAAPAPAPAAPAPASSIGSLGTTFGGLNLKKGQNASRGVMPNRGRGVLTQPGPRLAVCGTCSRQIRGPFITAGGNKFYCPEHFKCATQNCGRGLMEIGFVEERGQLYCEYCWESYLAPVCGKCNKRVKNECLNALGQHFHPSCFSCSHCHVCFGNNPFYLEDGRPFCEKDWNEMFTTKCFGCGFPIEAGDRWVEVLNQNYHSQCFNCTACKKNLEGQSFFAKGGRPFCKSHAR